MIPFYDRFNLMHSLELRFWVEDGFRTWRRLMGTGVVISDERIDVLLTFLEGNPARNLVG